MKFKQYAATNESVDWFSMVTKVEPKLEFVRVTVMANSPGYKQYHGAGYTPTYFTVDVPAKEAARLSQSDLAFGTKVVTTHGQYKVYTKNQIMYFEGITEANWMDSFKVPTGAWAI